MAKRGSEARSLRGIGDTGRYRYRNQLLAISDFLLLDDSQLRERVSGTLMAWRTYTWLVVTQQPQLDRTSLGLKRVKSRQAAFLVSLAAGTGCNVSSL